LTFSSCAAVGSNDSSSNSVGISEEKLRPSPGFLADTVYHLLRKCFIRPCALAPSIIGAHRQSMTRRFSQAHIARYRMRKYLTWKMFLYLFMHLIAQCRATVHHRRQHTEQLKRWIHALTNKLHRLKQL